MQGQLHNHALVKIADARNKNRAAFQASQRHDFWNVFVRQAKSVQLKGRGFAFFVGLYHLPPAPGIAADCGQTNRMVGGQNAGFYQWAQHGNGACGVTARVGYTLGLLDIFGLAWREFRKAVNPGGVGAVRG